MSELPQGWETSVLSEIVQDDAPIIYGILQPGPEVPDGVPYVRPTEIQSGQIMLDEVRRTSLPIAERYTRSTLDTGDIILSIVGTIGKVATVPHQLKGGNITQSSCRIRPNKQLVERDWVRYFLLSPLALWHYKESRLGTAVPRLNLADVRQFTIPLPPLAEQKRIVAKLDALATKSARARTDLARIDTLVEQLRVITLQSAFKGRLTDGMELTSVAIQVPEYASPEGLWSIPDSWSWCRTDQIGRVGLGRQRSPKNHDGPNMRRYLRSANITWRGVDTTDVKEMNFDAADFERFNLDVGDVLLNEGSGSAKEVGKPAIWRGEIADCCYQNTLLRVQPEHCSSEYLYYYFLFTALTGRFVASTQGVNIQHIGREGLARYPVPLAPQIEQREIVRRIESAFQKIDRLSAEAKRALELVGKLDEAILAKAFNGQLVPQDPNDEPASVLLERIKAERAAAPKGKRGRGKKLCA